MIPRLGTRSRGLERVSRVHYFSSSVPAVGEMFGLEMRRFEILQSELEGGVRTALWRLWAHTRVQLARISALLSSLHHSRFPTAPCLVSDGECYENTCSINSQAHRQVP
jgi:hypothetical protein